MAKKNMCSGYECNNVATVQHWDCCDGTSNYCDSCVWDGGQTAMCDWSISTLDGVLIREGQSSLCDVDHTQTS